MPEKSDDSCSKFGKRLTDAFKYCRDKSRQLTSGKKLHASVVEVCKHMRGVGSLQGDGHSQVVGDTLAVVPVTSAPKSKTLVCVSSDESALPAIGLPPTKTVAQGLESLDEIWKLYMPPTAAASS